MLASFQLSRSGASGWEARRWSFRICPKAERDSGAALDGEKQARFNRGCFTGRSPPSRNKGDCESVPRINSDDRGCIRQLQPFPRRDEDIMESGLLMPLSHS